MKLLLLLLLLEEVFAVNNGADLYFKNNCTVSMEHTTYDEKLSRKLLDLAAAAYDDSQHLKNRQRCLDKAFPNSRYILPATYSFSCDKYNNTCHVFTAISYQDNNVMIAFRGPKSYDNLVQQSLTSTDAYVPFQQKIVKSSQYEIFGNVESYLYSAFEKMWDKFLERKLIPANSFYVTGHGLGGALSSMTALRLSYYGFANKSNINMISFGAPRFGDFMFMSCYSNFVPNSFRVVHYRDVIPHLPKQNAANAMAMGSPFHHTQEIWYDDEFKTYKQCSTMNGEDPKCSISEQKIQVMDEGEIQHLHYFNVYVSEYGMRGCNSSPEFILSSFLFLFILLFIINK